MRWEQLRLMATGVTSCEVSKAVDADGISDKKRVGLIPRGGGLYIWNIGDEADAARFWLSPDGQTVAFVQVDEGHIPQPQARRTRIGIKRGYIHNQHDSINTCPTRGTSICICRDC